jgi:hypothetical protein
MSFGHDPLGVYRAAIEYVGLEVSTGYAIEGIDTDGDTDTDPEGAARAEKVPNMQPMRKARAADGRRCAWLCTVMDRGTSNDA